MEYKKCKKCTFTSLQFVLVKGKQTDLSLTKNEGLKLNIILVQVYFHGIKTFFS